MEKRQTLVIPFWEGLSQPFTQHVLSACCGPDLVLGK